MSGDEEGVLCDTISRKTLFYLIATLNAAFPDYDFSMAKVNISVNKNSKIITCFANQSKLRLQTLFKQFLALQFSPVN